MMSKTLAFELRINGVGAGEKAMEAIEKKAKSAKKAVSDLNSVLSHEQKTLETLAKTQTSVAAKERQFNQAARQELKAENEIRKTNASIRKRQAQDAVNAYDKERGSLRGMKLELKELTQQYDQLSRVQRNSTFGKGINKQIGGLQNSLKADEYSRNVFGRNVGNYPLGGAAGQLASNFSGGLVGNGASAGLVSAGLGAAALVKQVIQLNSEIDGLQANVRKTTGLNVRQVEDLTARFKALDTTTPIQELLEMSTIAGRFGIIGEKAVGDFVEKINLINIALGDNFTGGVEEITTALTQLSTVLYGASANGEIAADRMGKLGNAINVLDNNTSATAEQITDLTTRIAPLGRVIGFTDAQMLGTAATIKELGLNVEQGATAFNTLNKSMRSNAGAFANTIGVTKKELTNLLDTKPFEAMGFVINKLFEKAGNSPQRLLEMLKGLRVSGEGVSTVLSALALNQDRWTENVEDTVDAIDNQNSLLSEQQNILKSLPAQWDRLKNSVTELGADESFSEWLTNATSDLVDFFEILKKGKNSDAGNYFVGGLLGKAFEGTKLGDLFKAESKGARDRTLSGGSAAPYSGTDFLGRRTPGYNGESAIGSLLAPQLKTIKDGELTQKEKAALDKAAAKLEREKQRSIKKAEKAREAREAEDARGEQGSVARFKYEIGEVEKLLSQTNDNNLITQYTSQIIELNQGLLDSELRLRVIKSRIEGGGVFGPIGSRTSKGVTSGNEKDPFGKAQKSLQDSFALQDEDKKELKEHQDEAKEIYIDSAIDTTNSLFDIWDNYNRRKLDNDLKALDEEYEEKAKAVKGNSTLELALQKEFDKKREEAEREAARKAQRLAIIQANINGALAVIASFKTGFNPVSVAQAIAAGIATATQIAIIKSQKFAKGGFTGIGNGQRDDTGHVPVGVVHDGEWVANKKMVNDNPGLFARMESIQSKRYRGYASGGFTGEIPIPQIYNSGYLPSELRGLTGDGMKDFARIVASETATAIYNSNIASAQEKERIAERRNALQKTV